MNPQNKICQNCKKNFTIEPDDFSFYEKIKVSPPTWCPECRQLRRYVWRNERNLYRRNCDLCGKSTITMYSPNKPYKIYCSTCWWGDNWDTTIYGRDFDFSRPFFEQFAKLQRDVPRIALLSKNSVNSEYSNHSSDNKNAYLSISCFYGENIMYGTLIWTSRDLVDCNYIYEKGERLYECVDSRISYECQYGIFLKDCLSCFYCYDCRGCNNCFMSSNLRNRSYVFKNKQYSKEDYLQKINEIKLSSFLIREKLHKKFLSMIKEEAFHRYIIGERNINSTGNLISDCRNSIKCFETNEAENCKYMICIPDGAKDSYDIYHFTVPELCYEVHAGSKMTNSHFCHLSYDNMDIDYCDTCHNSQNLFGCVSVKAGEYMIFNKKYSRNHYLELKEKIIEHMKKTGEYGEFFPINLSPFGYNETQANLYAPMPKEEILAKGWYWENQIPGTFEKETIQPEEIPDRIEEVEDNICLAILKCINCGRNYNVIPNELSFYKHEKIPVPRKCPDCRYRQRFAIRLPRKLWHRYCMCDKKNHDHAGNCQNEFETSYAPDRPEKVYCENCYNKEVY